MLCSWVGGRAGRQGSLCVCVHVSLLRSAGWLHAAEAPAPVAASVRLKKSNQGKPRNKQVGREGPHTARFRRNVCLGLVLCAAGDFFLELERTATGQDGEVSESLPTLTAARWVS